MAALFFSVLPPSFIFLLVSFLSTTSFLHFVCPVLYFLSLTYKYVESRFLYSRTRAVQIMRDEVSLDVNQDQLTSSVAASANVKNYDAQTSHRYGRDMDFAH